jgi:hypothetical protein
MAADPPASPAIDRVFAGVGIALHLLAGVFPFAVSGLIAPLWGVVVLYAMWLAMLGVAVQLARTGRLRLVLAVPFAAVVAWFAVMSFGGAVLGWTA